MKWRPDGWENPWNYPIGSSNPIAFEAGADAMLDALSGIPDGVRVINAKSVLNGQIFRVLFVPEEKD